MEIELQHDPVDLSASQPTLPGAYEQFLVASFLLFQRSLNLAAEAGRRAAVNPAVFDNAPMRAGLEQVLQALDLCGGSLQRLPAPPAGAEDADQLIRQIGDQMRGFAVTLRELTLTPPGAAYDEAALDFQRRAVEIKHSFREALRLFEQVYPGRLDAVLRQVKAGG